jgi:hypothetical protein
LLGPVQLRSASRTGSAGLVLKPSCVTQLSVRELLRQQQPRRIYIITPETQLCEDYLTLLSDRVHCIHEDSVLPGVTKQAVNDRLLSRFPELHTNEFRSGRTPAGWYLQQVSDQALASNSGEPMSHGPMCTSHAYRCLPHVYSADIEVCRSLQFAAQHNTKQLWDMDMHSMPPTRLVASSSPVVSVQTLKLGVLQGISPLSDVYVLWDFDMLPLRPMRLFGTPRSTSQIGTCATAELPTVVHIGGKTPYGYKASYRSMLGKEYASLQCNRAPAVLLITSFATKCQVALCVARMHGFMLQAWLAQSFKSLDHKW